MEARGYRVERHQPQGRAHQGQADDERKLASAPALGRGVGSLTEEIR